MLILLPPSEGKAERRRGTPYEPAALSFPELGGPRAQVATALATVSARPDAGAVLGLPPTLAGQAARNTRLASAPALPARELYTGVLYDHLDVATLDAASRRRASARVVILSGLFGALRLGDRVPPYRCPMGATLPPLGRLAAFWRAHLGTPLTAAAGNGLVVDCRSSDYVAAWRPGGALRQRWVQVQVPGASHNAKLTRGCVARALAEAPRAARSPQALAELLADSFEVDLAPVSAGWVLRVADVSARGR